MERQRRCKKMNGRAPENSLNNPEWLHADIND